MALPCIPSPQRSAVTSSPSSAKRGHEQRPRRTRTCAASPWTRTRSRRSTASTSTRSTGSSPVASPTRITPRTWSPTSSSPPSTARRPTTRVGGRRWPGCSGSPATSSPTTCDSGRANGVRSAASVASDRSRTTPSPRPQERIDAAAGARAVYGALGRLPPDQRAVVELVALDGLTVGDAARTLGVQPVTARVRLHRARRSVAAALGATADPTPGDGPDRPTPPRSRRWPRRPCCDDHSHPPATAQLLRDGAPVRAARRGPPPRALPRRRADPQSGPPPSRPRRRVRRGRRRRGHLSPWPSGAPPPTRCPRTPTAR